MKNTNLLIFCSGIPCVSHKNTLLELKKKSIASQVSRVKLCEGQNSSKEEITEMFLNGFCKLASDLHNSLVVSRDVLI